MTAAGPAFERYRSRDSEEWLMRIGAEEALPILFVPPLFEEMNRTRALLATIMRKLAGRGFGCWLPDLSGTGESETALAGVSWQNWRHDVTAASRHILEKARSSPLVASLRGGSLLDDAAAARGFWRLAPVDGSSLARDMKRAGIAGVEWAGYAPNEALKAALEAAKPAPVAPLRIAQLQSHATPGDARLPGPALWRRSEPGTSEDLAEAAAGDLAEWSQHCAG
ncbi:MAG: hypothetical protein ACXW2T_03250 [Allosphingosinicella sp.]